MNDLLQLNTAVQTRQQSIKVLNMLIITDY